MAEFSVVIGSAELNRVIRALRVAEVRMPGELHDEVVEHALLMADVARKEALSLPARGHEHTGIRKRMARSVRTRRTHLGAEVTSEPRARDAAVFVGFDNPVRGWKHPVPNVKQWVRQWPGDSDGWFRIPLKSEPLVDHLESELADVVDRNIDRIV